MEIGECFQFLKLAWVIVGASGESVKKLRNAQFHKFYLKKPCGSQSQYSEGNDICHKRFEI